MKTYFYIQGGSIRAAFNSGLELLLHKLKLLIAEPRLKAIGIHNGNINFYLTEGETVQSSMLRTPKESFLFFDVYSQMSLDKRKADDETKNIYSQVLSSSKTLMAQNHLNDKPVIGNKHVSLVYVFNRATFYPVLSVPTVKNQLALPLENMYNAIVPLSVTCLYRLIHSETSYSYFLDALHRFESCEDEKEITAIIESMIEGINKNMSNKESYVSSLMHFRENPEHKEFIDARINLDFYLKEE